MTGYVSKNIKMFVSVFHIVGLLLVMEGLFMFASCLPSLYEIMVSNNAQTTAFEWQAVKVLGICAVLTVSCGLALYLPLKKKHIFIDKRCGFLIVSIIWVVFSLFGCLPHIIGGYINNFTDAFFETMSGFTTTGASVLTDVESLPYSIGLWRVLTEWIGGVGIIVIMLSVIPIVGGGGMALYAAEVPGLTKDKLSPRIKGTSGILISVYISLTILYVITYHIAGMHWFDSLCYGFTTISTGGLTSHNDSAMSFAPHLQYIIMFFMFLSGTNLLYFYFIFKKNFKKVLKSEELRVYISIIIIASLTVFILTFSPADNIEQTLRHAFFMVTTTLTSSGLVNYDFMSWQTGAIVVLAMLMLSGAMSGSTSGGLKLVRTLILFKAARANIKRSLHNNAFIPITLDKKPLSDDLILNVFAMFTLYIMVACVGFCILLYTGVPLEESGISVISALSNIGISYGESAMGNFVHFTTLGKWTMSILMCVGRLELITVFSIFTRSFWRR